MIKSILVLTLLVLSLTMAVTHSLPSIYSNYSKPMLISSIQIYKDLMYKITLEKKTVINQTITKTINSTSTTTTTEQSQVYIPVSAYSVNYTVTHVNGTLISVEINGNFSSNFTFIEKGNFTINLYSDVVSLNYPYIAPFLLLNSTYALINQNSTYVISYIGLSSYQINGQNYTVYRYAVVTNSTFHVYELLDNGYLANYTTTYGNYTLVMNLMNAENPTNITLNTTVNPGLFKPYLYLEYLYSEVAKDLQPNIYVEVYYPFVSGNYIGQILYLLYPQQGSPIVPNSFYGINVNFELYFKPVDNSVLTFIPSNSTTIQWNGRTLTFVNVTPVTLVNGTTVYAKLYKGETFASIIYLYFSNTSGTLVQELVYSAAINNYSVKLQLIGNQYVPINITYPTLTSPVYKTLPYSLVNFNEGLVVAIVITVVLSAIIILFRQR